MKKLYEYIQKQIISDAFKRMSKHTPFRNAYAECDNRKWLIKDGVVGVSIPNIYFYLDTKSLFNEKLDKVNLSSLFEEDTYDVTLCDENTNDKYTVFKRNDNGDYIYVDKKRFSLFKKDKKAELTFKTNARNYIIYVYNYGIRIGFITCVRHVEI